MSRTIDPLAECFGGDVFAIKPSSELHDRKSHTKRLSSQAPSDQKPLTRSLSGSGIFHSMKLRVAEIRKRRGWTQERLAEEANMTLHVLRKYEQDKGGMSSLDKIDKLAKALDVDPLVLLSEDAERLLNARDRGYDEQTMVEALTMAIETTEQKRLRMKPEQVARMALLFYDTRMSGGDLTEGD